MVLFGCDCSRGDPAPTILQPSTPIGAAPSATGPSLPQPGTVPFDVGSPTIPQDNPPSGVKVAFGHSLFFDARLSVDGTYFNAGVGLAAPDPAAINPGRQAASRRDEDFGAFKPPTLRNVARSAPHLHDGSAPNLEAAVRYMASGGVPNPQRSPLLANRDLTEPEFTDPRAFLGALDCGRINFPPGYVDKGKPL
ncbi:MAG: hypothetical protein JW751_02220 [Polyangiaceae bacterium]|nr:hypothetical protein [Polyangiaceae bacterium]